jgi:hypothetical protein
MHNVVYVAGRVFAAKADWPETCTRALGADGFPVWLSVVTRVT